jgi:hypothetical protein
VACQTAKKATKCVSLKNSFFVVCVSGRTIEVTRHVPPRWCKPPVGKWKINWDASINKMTRKTGIRVVIRDEEGRVVAASARTIPYILDPSSTKAMGAWVAVLLGREVRSTSITLEGDSLEVVLALRRKDLDNMSYGHLIHDTRVCFSFFNSLDIVHVRRDANKAAHVLAHCASSQMLDQVWLEECPPLIQQVVAVEQDV